MAQERNLALVVTLPSDTEITLTRAFNAPRELVFEALTNPEHVPHYWGPSAMTMTVCEIDLRVGGRWRFVQLDPEGNEVGFHGSYREIARPERLVYTEVFEGAPDAESLVTSFLDERDGITTLTVTAAYPTREVRDFVVSTGMEHGAAETYDRLEALLARLQGA